MSSLKTDKSLSNYPGPKGLELLKWGLKLKEKKMQHYLELQKLYGNVVRCTWFNKDFIFIFDSELTNYILKTNHTNYLKSKQYKQMIPLLGNGLLLSEGNKWRKQRSIMAKEFHSQRLNEFSDSMKLICSEYFSKNLPLTNPNPSIEIKDIYSFFSELTFQIACELFFGTRVEKDAKIVQESLATEAENIQNRTHRLINFPRFFPTSENTHSRKAINALNTVVKKIMFESNHQNKSNILSKLIQYKDSQNLPLENKLIRDEVMTLMLAGHETTSTALMWTVLCLCQNTHYQNLYRKIPISDQSSRNAMIKSFLNEGMRLYPPVPIYSRRAVDADKFKDFTIPSNVTLAIVPYVLHRDPVHWKNPLQFMPERFLETDSEKKYENIFIPFAKGPRACIGKDLAMLEGEMILKHLLDNFEFSSSLNSDIHPLQNLTLRSNKKIPVLFKRVINEN